MRVFKRFSNNGQATCPICRTWEDKPVVLLPIPGTEDDGIVEAHQVHVDCFRYWLDYCQDDPSPSALIKPPNASFEDEQDLTNISLDE